MFRFERRQRATAVLPRGTLYLCHPFPLAVVVSPRTRVVAWPAGTQSAPHVGPAALSFVWFLRPLTSFHGSLGDGPCTNPHVYCRKSKSQHCTTRVKTAQRRSWTTCRGPAVQAGIVADGVAGYSVSRPRASGGIESYQLGALVDARRARRTQDVEARPVPSRFAKASSGKICQPNRYTNSGRLAHSAA